MTYTPALAIRAVQAIVYGDIFMRTVYRMRPYETVPGSVNAMHEKWKRICNNDLKRAPSMTRFNHIIKDMIRDFDNIPIYEDKVIPRVGIVGEILVKFLPQANNHLVTTATLRLKNLAQAVLLPECAISALPLLNI